MIIVVLLLLFLTGCNLGANLGTDEVDSVDEVKLNWRIAPLNNLLTNSSFKIEQFNKPILISLFNVDCLECKDQHDSIKKLYDDVGDNVIPISLDIDLTDDEAKVKDYYKTNEYNWLFVLSSLDVTQSIVEDFGKEKVNLDGSTVILVCPNNETKMFDVGVKSVLELREKIINC